MSTFDLDMNVLDTMIPPSEDTSRYVVFHGDGLFDEYTGSPARAQELIVYSCVRKLHAVEKVLNIRKTFRYITCTDSLKVMDRMVVDMIRRAASGHSGKQRYCIRYRTIQKMGFRSLVSQYYNYLENKQGKA